MPSAELDSRHLLYVRGGVLDGPLGLEERGFVARRFDPNERRATLVAVTGGC